MLALEEKSETGIFLFFFFLWHIAPCLSQLCWTTFITTGNFWYCFLVPVFLCSFQPVMACSVVYLVWVFILIVMTSVMTHLASWFFCESSSWMLTLLEVHFFMAFWGCFSSPSFFFSLMPVLLLELLSALTFSVIYYCSILHVALKSFRFDAVSRAWVSSLSCCDE